MTTNKVDVKTERGLGTSDTKSLSETFPASPTDFDPLAAMKALLDGIQTENPDFGAFSMDYSDSPDIEKFVPNPTSPGPGDVNPNNKGPEPSSWPPPASGFGSQAEPKDSASKISEQKFDTLLPGKSS